MMAFDVFDLDTILMCDRRNDPTPVLKPILGPQHLVRRMECTRKQMIQTTLVTNVMMYMKLGKKFIFLNKMPKSK